MDTEGSEYAILKDFPFEEYTFLAISVEHNSIEQSKESLCHLLVGKGYVRVKEEPVDDYYVHCSLLHHRESCCTM